MTEITNSPENQAFEPQHTPQPDAIEHVGAPEVSVTDSVETIQHPDFPMIHSAQGSSQTAYSSKSNRSDKGSVQVLVLFLLGSFSICSAMLNLYLFWQARNLGAEIERLKPASKSGLAPRH